MKRKLDSNLLQNPSKRINRKKKLCEKKECKTIPVFGLIWKKPTHCKGHKTPEMKDVVNKQCEFEGCETIPNFGLIWKKPTHCKGHKTPEMKNVVDKRCQFEGCEILPAYGLIWKKPTHCKGHKTPAMKDVVNKQCEFRECKTRPNFGLIWKKPTHCKRHKTEEMKNVVDKQCQFEGCETLPAYGLIWKKPTHCKGHKTPAMKNVVNKQCEFEGCETRPNFGLIWKKPTHCAGHKTPEMKDVKNKRCQIEGCEIRPNYGLIWKKPTHCLKHKTTEMFNDKKRKPKCHCGSYAFYGISAQAIIHCEKHKSFLEKDFVREKCGICEEWFTPDKIEETKFRREMVSACSPCSNRWRNQRRKEFDLRDYVLEGKYDYSHNETVKPGICSSTNMRPDFVIKFPLFNVIIEVDENQHTSYKKMCESSIHKELSRIISIHENDFGGCPMVVIRFNPDKYKSPKKRNWSKQRRLKTVSTFLRDLKNKTRLESNLNCYYLFYDGFDGSIVNRPIEYNINKGRLLINHEHPTVQEKEFAIKL